MKCIKTNYSFNLYLSIVFFCMQTQLLYAWTHTYQKIYNVTARKKNAQKKDIFFSQLQTQSFTQLLLSWNAQKPEQGHFIFYTQVQDAKTKKWGKWHRMYTWGNAEQSSYFSQSDGISTNHYVRLEADEKKSFSGFRVKVIAKNSDLSLVHGLFVCISDMKQFRSERYMIAEKQFDSVYISNVGKISQFNVNHKDAARICSPISCVMIQQFLTKQQEDVLGFVESVFDMGLGIYGSWQFNVAHLFASSGKAAYIWVQRFFSFEQLYAQLQNNLPVVVSVRGYLPGALKRFPHGHLLVVVGFDAATNTVICHDPACYNIQQVEKKYALKDFILAWENSRRLGYCISSINV